MRRLKAQPLKGRPLVSVVVPCYNYGRFLPDAVGSVLDQQGVDVEVIIVDDASTDDSAEAAETLASDPRVTLVRHETNLGHIVTYNDGLSRVTGDLVVLLSADDLLAPGSLARAAALFEARPEVGLVYGYTPEFNRTPPRPANSGDPTPTWTVWSGEEWTRRICQRGSNVIVNPEAVVRRAVLESIGGYDPGQPHAADMCFWIEAARFGSIGRVNRAEQAYYRVHGGNMHLGEFEGQYRDALERRIVFDALRHADRLTRCNHLRALDAISRECLRAARMSAARGTPEALASAAAFEALALQCCPGIDGSLRWLVYRALGGARGRGAAAPFEAWLDRLRWSLAWRRWRRAGT